MFDLLLLNAVLKAELCGATACDSALREPDSAERHSKADSAASRDSDNQRDGVLWYRPTKS